MNSFLPYHGLYLYLTLFFRFRSFLTLIKSYLLIFASACLVNGVSFLNMLSASKLWRVLPIISSIFLIHTPIIKGFYPLLFDFCAWFQEGLYLVSCMLLTRFLSTTFLKGFLCSTIYILLFININL